MMIPNKFNGYSADGRRQYCKGGDGGAGEARRQEEERQKRIQKSVDMINGIFDGQAVKSGVNQAKVYDQNKTYYDEKGNVVGLPKLQDVDQAKAALFQFTNRNAAEGGSYEQNDAVDLNEVRKAQENAAARKQIDSMLKGGQLFEGISETAAPTKTRDQLYAEQKTAVYDINKRDVDKQYQEAERQNRFGLARSGLLGGSADVDSNAQLQEKTNEGLMKAVGIADQAAADLKTQDERSRQSLISMAQSGIDTGTAQQMAMRQLDATAQNANGARQGASIGGLFDGLSQAYLARQYANGVKTGSTQGNQWYPNLSTATGDSGSITR